MKNPNDQYNIGKALAISWFIKNNYHISLPLNCHLPYDLLIDKGDGSIKKVKVATTSYKNPHGNYDLNLRSTFCNFYGVSKVAKFNSLLTDYIFVDCDHKEFYFIPSSSILTSTKITLSCFLDYKISREDS